MNCEHDIVEITTVGDEFRRGLCVKCDTRFVGPRKTYEARDILPVYLTESEFATLRDIATKRAAALGMSESNAMADIRVAEYQIVARDSISDLELMVNQMIGYGWQPYGTPITTHGFWYQPMVKHATSGTGGGE